MKLVVLFILLLSAENLYSQYLPPLPGILPVDSATFIAGLKTLNIPKLPSGDELVNTDCGCTAGCSVVPVSLLKFEGIRLNEAVVALHWKTENEINNAGFYVERKLGEQSAFSEVAFVQPGNAAGRNYYSLNDANRFTGVTYYRLRQKDIDGHFAYSQTIAINGFDKSVPLITYPNPANEQIFIRYYASEDEMITISVFDATLRSVLSRQQNLKKGFQVISLDVSMLASGIYIIKLKSGDKPVESRRFIVQHR